MNRFALIIEASDVKGQAVLPGAKRDAEQWRNFLMSNIGGAWNENEIIVLNKPSSDLVTDFLTRHISDYCFVAYSGHGCEIKRYSWQTEGIPTVCLNDTETTLPLSRLKPHGSCGTLIADSCRGYELMTKTAANFSKRSDSRGLVVEDATKSAYLACLHYQGWKQALQQCCNTQNGILTMYSCASGQAAGEDPNAGGIYTSFLIQSARIWYDAAKSNKYYTTWNAHDDADKLMKIYAPQQTPEYQSLPVKFPFAIKYSI